MPVAARSGGRPPHSQVVHPDPASFANSIIINQHIGPPHINHSLYIQVYEIEKRHNLFPPKKYGNYVCSMNIVHSTFQCDIEFSKFEPALWRKVVKKRSYFQSAAKCPLVNVEPRAAVDGSSKCNTAATLGHQQENNIRKCIKSVRLVRLPPRSACVRLHQRQICKVFPQQLPSWKCIGGK